MKHHQAPPDKASDQPTLPLNHGPSARPRRTRLRLRETVAAQDRVPAQSTPPEDTPLPVFLFAREAAELLRISHVTLARWRIEGQGPAFQKFGRRVVYAREELLAWAKLQTRRSTSE
jgi:Helix-turn-helix domain